MAKNRNPKTKMIEGPPIGEDAPIVQSPSIPESYKKGYCQWLIEGDTFLPMTKSIEMLPPGFYNIKYDRNYDKHVLVKRDVLSEELLELPDSAFGDILSDIDKFWSSRAAYDEYDYVYKRGILLYGVPGCGKTCLILLVAQKLIGYREGVVINIREADDIYGFDDIVSSLREIEPDKKIISVIEDIDNFITKDQELLTKLMNILDGNMQYDNIVSIATTNFPERLEERISNRPSRFDLRREIGPPKARTRRFYLNNKLKDNDLSKKDIDMWVKETRGFTLDHLKELVLLVFVLGHTFDDSIEEIRNMMNNAKPENTPSGNRKKRLGFNSVLDDDDEDDCCDKAPPINPIRKGRVPRVRQSGAGKASRFS